MAASKQTVINWMLVRVGRVAYSPAADKRQGPDYYDSASSVFCALIAGGYLPKDQKIGYVDDLFDLEGKLLIPIYCWQVHAGDVFLTGGINSPNQQAGIAVNKFQIVHCSQKHGGMVRTWTMGQLKRPVYWYRLAEPSEDFHLEKKQIPTMAYC